MEEKKGLFEGILGFAAGVIKLPFKAVGWALDEVEKVPVLGKVATGIKFITTPIGNLGGKLLDGTANIASKPLDWLWGGIEKVPVVGHVARGIHGLADGAGALGTNIGNWFTHIPDNWNILVGKMQNRPFISGLQRTIGALTNVLIKMVQTILESLQNNAMKVGEAVQDAENKSIAATKARISADKSDGLIGFAKDKYADIAESRADKAIQNVDKVMEEGKKQMAEDFGSLAPDPGSNMRRELSEVLANGNAMAAAQKIAGEKGIDLSGTIEQALPNMVPGR